VNISQPKLRSEKFDNDDDDDDNDDNNNNKFLDINVFKKEAENILKYKDLTIENQCMWNVKAKVIPVTIGATGTIPKSLRQYLSNTPGKHEVKELRKTATLCAAHIYCGKC